MNGESQQEANNQGFRAFTITTTSSTQICFGRTPRMKKNQNAIHCRLDELAIDSLCGLHRFSFVGQHAKHCTNVMTSCKPQTLWVNLQGNWPCTLSLFWFLWGVICMWRTTHIDVITFLLVCGSCQTLVSSGHSLLAASPLMAPLQTKDTMVWQARLEDGLCVCTVNTEHRGHPYQTECPESARSSFWCPESARFEMNLDSERFCLPGNCLVLSGKWPVADT